MYIDPNTGGMLFQVLAVAVGVFSAVIFFFSGKIRFTFAKLRRQMRERSHPEASLEPKPVISDDQTTPPAS